MDVLDGRSRGLLRSAVAIVPARDMEASVGFYERLGFVCERYEDGSQYAFLSRDGSSLHLALQEDEETAANPAGVYFVVEDVDALFDEVQGTGLACLGSPEEKPWRMREFAMSDPAGTLLRFGEPAHAT